MKSYTINALVSVANDPESYGEAKPINFSFTEKVPKGEDPIKYLRKRLTEEVKRASDLHGDSLEWEDKPDEEEII